MKAKLVKESLNNLPTWDELINTAPQEILDLIEKSKITPQGTNYHPEGEVYRHVRIVFDRASETGDINLVLVALFHDLGKVNTTKPNKKGGWSAHAHEFVSAKLVEKYKEWIENLGGDWIKVHEIVVNHMRIKQMGEMRRTKREALKNTKYYNELLQFTEFDDMKTLTKDEFNRYK